MKKIGIVWVGLIGMLSACGGGSGSGSEIAASVNSPPELTGVLDYSVDENTTTVTTFQAVDSDGDHLTYSISGDDASSLSIDASLGLLTFKSAPDFENPLDSDQDNIYSVTISASDGQASASLGIIITVNDVDGGVEGYNMVLIGNSFFMPYAERIGAAAINAGFTSHIDTGVFAGGESGRPIGLWNDTGQKNRLIKEALDRGDVDVLGMTGTGLSEGPTAGFRDWIAYALQNNPDIDVFVSVPPFDFPATWEQRAQEAGFDEVHDAHAYFVNELINKTLIDGLRAEFPSTHIFSIPTGKAAIELWQMYKDDLLSDEILFIGPSENSLFTDEKGHQGSIIVMAGTLMWINSLYQVHLTADEFDTGFNTDLHALVERILIEHDPHYSR